MHLKVMFKNLLGRERQLSLTSLLGKYAWIQYVGDKSLESGALIRRETVERLQWIAHKWPGCDVLVGNPSDTRVDVSLECDSSEATKLMAFIHQGYICHKEVEFCFKNLSHRVNTTFVLLNQQDIAEMLPVQVITTPTAKVVAEVSQLVNEHELKFRFIPKQGIFGESLVIICPNDEVQRIAWYRIAKHTMRKKQPIVNFL